MQADIPSQPTTDTHAHERRLDRWAWLTLLAGFGIMAISFFNVLWAFSVPTDGWWVRQESGGADAPIRLLINQSGQPSSLREGDLILMMNGQRPEEFVPGVGPILEKGRPLTYLINRDGQEIELTIQPVVRKPYGIWQVIIHEWQEGPINVLATVFFFLIGAFVFFMRPENLGGRYLFLVGCYYICNLWGFADNFYMVSLYPNLLIWLGGVFGGASWAWLFFPLLIQMVLIFPRRIGPMRRRPRLFPILIHGVPAAILIAGSIPFFMSGDPADLGLYTDQLGIYVLLPMILLFLFTLVAAMIYNFRTIHEPVERAQLRWVLLGIGFGLGGMIAVYFVGGLLDMAGLLTERIGSVILLMMNLLLLCLPLGLGIAILRYRLFDIDIIIRKTTSYAIITGLLALVYFGSIVVLQRLLAPVTGESDLAVVLSTLLIAALFLPLRRRVQDVIDRRFFRRKYDAEKVLHQFAATARDETDLDALTAELLRVIQETMEPESVSLWLRPARPVLAPSVPKQLDAS